MNNCKSKHDESTIFLKNCVTYDKQPSLIVINKNLQCTKGICRCFKSIKLFFVVVICFIIFMPLARNQNELHMRTKLDEN